MNIIMKYIYCSYKLETLDLIKIRKDRIYYYHEQIKCQEVHTLSSVDFKIGGYGQFPNKGIKPK